MTRSALPTGPCGSRTPSLHDAVDSAALAIEMLAATLRCAWRSSDLRGDRSGLAACITNSIGYPLTRSVMGRDSVQTPRSFPIPPMGGSPDCHPPIEGMEGVVATSRSFADIDA